MPSGSVSQVSQCPAPEYDLTDEENLPSPFLTKSDQNSSQAKAVGLMINITRYFYVDFINLYSKRRPSSGLLLRALAAANNVGRRGTRSSTTTVTSTTVFTYILNQSQFRFEKISGISRGSPLPITFQAHIFKFPLPSDDILQARIQNMGVAEHIFDVELLADNPLDADGVTQMVYAIQNTMWMMEGVVTAIA
jgi:hypothetical protein